MDETDFLQQKLAELKREHRDLDEIIDQLTESSPFDEMKIMRLKKRKLLLKDEILKVESQLLPDIIA